MLLKGLISVVDSCVCGIYAMAKCLRCGQPRCTNHYFLGGRRHVQVPTLLLMDAPGTGVVEVSLASELKPFSDQFLAAGPGCYWCREEVAQKAAGAHAREARALIRSFIAAPRLGSATAVLAAVTSAAPDQREAVLAAIGSLAKTAPSLRVLCVRLEPDPRYRESPRNPRRTDPVARILSSVPAVAVQQGPIVAENGEAFVRKWEHGTDTTAIEVHACTVYIANQAGTLPEFRYVRRELGGSYGSLPQPAMWRFRDQVRRES